DVDPAFAGRVGDVVGRLHAASAADASVEKRFATDANFDALRITPSLRVSAERNPAVADRLHELADRLAGTRLALVHGDLSPKNILTHPTTAILLDAECAWFGDPAFDLAFCLTHLLLKSRVRPDRAGPLREAAERLLAAHRSHLDWEPRTGSTSASPGSCPRCSSPGSTGRRRSSTSPSPATGPRSGR